MSHEDVLIRESVGDGTLDPDDACMVCDKIECECPPEVTEKRTRSIEDWIESIDRERCSACGGKMLTVYHRRGSLLPVCALCADEAYERERQRATGEIADLRRPITDKELETIQDLPQYFEK